MFWPHAIAASPNRPDLGTRPRERCGELAMRSDFDIKRDVEDELRSDPDIRNRYRHRGERWCRDTDRVRSQLSPEARGGARCQACRWRVGMANNIEVRLPIVHRRPDPEIARDAVEEIQRDLPSFWEKIKVI